MKFTTNELLWWILLQMRSFCDEFYYKWRAFVMNFTVNEELLWWILQQMSFCDEFYYKWRAFVTNFTLYCSNWYNFVVKSMKWKCWKFERITTIFQQMDGFTTVDNLLFLWHTERDQHWGWLGLACETNSKCDTKELFTIVWWSALHCSLLEHIYFNLPQSAQRVQKLCTSVSRERQKYKLKRLPRAH